MNVKLTAFNINIIKINDTTNSATHFYKTNKSYYVHKTIFPTCGRDIASPTNILLSALKLHAVAYMEKFTEKKIGIKINITRKFYKKEQQYCTERFVWLTKS